MTMQLVEIREFIEKRDKIKSVTKLKSPGLFDNSDTSQILDSFFEKLAINSTMSISEIVSVLQYLENVSVKIDSKPTYISLAQNLREDNRPSLESLEIGSINETVNVRVNKNSPLHQFLIENHQLLVGFYKRAHSHIQGKSQASELCYSPEQLAVANSFYDMETTTKAEKAADGAQVIGDIKRKGVTFYGAVVYPRNMDDPIDSIILQTIENFAGDSLDEAHSKASKILNFGGQFIEGVLLQEFTRTTKFAEEASSADIYQGSVKGHINWSKEAETEHIYATINLKVLTCLATNNDIHSIYSIASDGSTLIALEGDDLEKVLARCAKGWESNIVPICEMDGRIGLVPNKEGQGYMMKMEQFSIKYYTPELLSEHSEGLEARQSLNPG